MRAALPMYDFPDVADATDALWAGIRDAFRAIGIEAPDHREKHDDVWELWRAPDLVFAQTCGYPYMARLRDQVTLIGTPDYNVCEGRPGFYDSVIVARTDAAGGLEAYRGTRFACNSKTSQSGCWAMMSAIKRRFGEDIFFADIVMTGSHAGSVEAVAAGRADVAAIDAVSWRHIRRANPAARALQVVDRSEPMPGLPFICAAPVARPGMFQSVRSAIGTLPAKHKAALGLHGLVDLGTDDYQIIVDRADEAKDVFEKHFKAIA